MFCPHCGSSNPDGSAFCKQCGNHLQEGGRPGQEYGSYAAGPPPPPSPPPLPPSGPRRIRGWVIALIVAACVLLAGGAVAAVFLLRSNDGDDKSSALSTMTTRRTTTSTAVVSGNGSSTTSNATGATRSWGVDRVELLLTVQPNSDVTMEETLKFTFKGHFTWVTRALSESEPVEITGLEVWQDGRQLPQGQDPGNWESYLDGSQRIIKLHTDVTDGSKTWTIKYVVRGVVVRSTEGDTDELAWWVFGEETPVAVAKVSVTVQLPGKIPAGDMAANVQTGDGVQYEMDSPVPSTIVYTGSDVPANTAFWIYASFPAGVVELPGR